MKTAKHPTGLTINFNEKEHRYVDENNNVYNSVTSVIHSLFPKFDAEKISVFVARKRGCTQTEVLNEWEEKRSSSSNFGDKIHNYAECLLTQKTFVDNYNKNTFDYQQKEKGYLKQTEEIIPKLLKCYDLIGAEKIIFSPDNKLSGTIDILMRNKRTKTLAIFDWKTNEEIRNLNKHKATQTGLYSLSHIPDANFYHYALQLNTYRKILINEKYFEDTNFEMAIFHIQENKIVPYKLPLLEKESDYILEAAKKMNGESNENSLYDNN